MAKYSVTVMFTGSMEIEVEANSTNEAREKAWEQVEPEMIMEWDVDLDDVECIDGEDEEEEW